jgi:DNA-binding CsgD family transcriptional regulator
MTITSTPDISGVPLTDRQRQVWEMTHGLGDYNQPMRASEIAKELGISTNAVYVTRRRVRQILEDQGLVRPGEKQPKRIIRQKSGLEEAIDSLRDQLLGYDSEEESLKNRLELIEKTRPDLQEALERLERLEAIQGGSKPVNEPEPVAA